MVSLRKMAQATILSIGLLPEETPTEVAELVLSVWTLTTGFLPLCDGLPDETPREVAELVLSVWTLTTGFLPLCDGLGH